MNNSTSSSFNRLYEITEQKSPKVKKVDNSYISNNHQDTKIPLKSEINSKVFVQNGNTPFINKYTINLHEEIANGKYDKLIGSEAESKPQGPGWKTGNRILGCFSRTLLQNRRLFYCNQLQKHY